MSLSRPTKIIALAGLALLIGIGAVGTLALSQRKVASQPAITSHHAIKPLKNAAVHSSRPRIDAALPATLRAALARSATVVAVLDAPGIAGDAGAVKAARTGAKAAHVGFAVLNVRNEATAAALAQQAPNATDPAVLVVRRPGTIAVELDGYADSETVAQAAVDARP